MKWKLKNTFFSLVMRILRNPVSCLTHLNHLWGIQTTRTHMVSHKLCKPKHYFVVTRLRKSPQWNRYHTCTPKKARTILYFIVIHMGEIKKKIIITIKLLEKRAWSSVLHSESKILYQEGNHKKHIPIYRVPNYCSIKSAFISERHLKKKQKHLLAL